MNLPDYRVALVMTRAGLNDRQLAYFRAHLKQVARDVGGPFNLIVPAIVLHGGPRKSDPHGAKLTESLLSPLRQRMDWLRVEVIFEVEVANLLQRLLPLDEVWCATSRTMGSELASRPGQVYQMAQGFREAPRFKMLHFWIELPPSMLASLDRGTPKKKPQVKALKGY